jgi:hypothetical protein
LSALALGGCASLSELYPECSHLDEGTEPFDQCVIDAKEYQRVETYNNYIQCKRAADDQNMVWVTVTRGVMRRDRDGVPLHRLDMRTDMAQNGCVLWSK